MLIADLANNARLCPTMPVVLFDSRGIHSAAWFWWKSRKYYCCSEFLCRLRWVALGPTQKNTICRLSYRNTSVMTRHLSASDYVHINDNTIKANTGYKNFIIHYISLSAQAQTRMSLAQMSDSNMPRSVAPQILTPLRLPQPMLLPLSLLWGWFRTARRGRGSKTLSKSSASPFHVNAAHVEARSVKASS